MTQTQMAAGAAVSIVLIAGVYYLFSTDPEPEQEQEPVASPDKKEEAFTPVVNVSKQLSQINEQGSFEDVSEPAIVQTTNEEADPITIEDQTQPYEESALVTEVLETHTSEVLEEIE